MIIAITGCIGSGKSYIASLIQKHFGYDTFSSDNIAKESYDDEFVKSQLQEAFNCIVDGKVDKNIIKEQLNDQTISKLNSIIHPYVKSRILNIKQKYINDVAFVEVPLLFESKMEELFDKTLVIFAKDALRHKRIKKRNPQTYKDMIKLEHFQLNNEEKVEKADYVLIDNEVANARNLIIGANKTEYHIENANYGRDFEG